MEDGNVYELLRVESNFFISAIASETSFALTKLQNLRKYSELWGVMFLLITMILPGVG